MRVSASACGTLWVSPASAGLRHPALAAPGTDVIQDCYELERAIDVYGLAAGRIIPERRAGGIRIEAYAIASGVRVGLGTWRRDGQHTSADQWLACGCDASTRAIAGECLAFTEWCCPTDAGGREADPIANTVQHAPGYHPMPDHRLLRGHALRMGALLLR